MERPVPLLAKGLSTVFHSKKEFIMIEKITDIPDIPLQERCDKMPTYPQYGWDVKSDMATDRHGHTVHLSQNDTHRFRIQMLIYQYDKLMDRLLDVNNERHQLKRDLEVRDLKIQDLGQTVVRTRTMNDALVDAILKKDKENS
jgi:hypothetical protein